MFLQAACHHGSRRSNDYAAAYLLLVRAHQYGVGEDQVPKRLLDEDYVFEPHHQLGIYIKENQRVHGWPVRLKGVGERTLFQPKKEQGT